MGTRMQMPRGTIVRLHGLGRRLGGRLLRLSPPRTIAQPAVVRDPRLAAVALAAAALLPGCGNDADQSGSIGSDPEETAIAYVRAAVDGTPAAACELADRQFERCTAAANEIASHYDVETLFAGGRDEIGSRKALIQVPLVEPNGTTGKVARMVLRRQEERWSVRSAAVDTPRGVE